MKSPSVDSSGPRNRRRNFIRQVGLSSLSFLAAPLLANSRNNKAGKSLLPEIPHPEDETYWEAVKKQFSVPDKLIMMNAANLCPAPAFINEQVNEYTNALGRDVSFQYRATLTEKRNKALHMLAQFTGVSVEELGITRNTSESNSIIVNSLDLVAGDEIIIWDQNHPSANAAFELRARRYGFKLIKITLPANPASQDELVVPFERAITSKTKLIAFSHISNVSGLALPAKSICALARSKNILTLVDGAQSLGLMDLNLKDMGCDFFSSSTHKWLMGSLENGILYVDKRRMNMVWPVVTGGGWKESSSTDQQLCVLGQRNEATAPTLPAIIEFHNKIGKKNIENRVVQLNSYLKQQLRAHLPGVVFVTPLATEFSAGIVIFNLPGKDPRIIHQQLYEKHGIASAASGGIRFSPHIYNTLKDVDRVVAAVKSLSA